MQKPGPANSFFSDVAKFFLDEPLNYVDVGAYVGETLQDLQTSGLSLRRATLFEPNPESLPTLRDNTASLGSRVTIHKQAVSSATGSAVLQMRQSMSHVHLEPPAVQGARGTTIETTSLDEWFLSADVRRIHILKLDVEGHELQVLRGAQDLLARQDVDVLYVEVGFNPANTQQVYIEDVTEALREHGYTTYRIYEQMYEWPEDSPTLRRANVAFFSERFRSSHPYGLTETAATEHRQRKALASELRAAKRRIAHLNKEVAHHDKRAQLSAAHLAAEQHRSTQLESALSDAERCYVDSVAAWTTQWRSSLHHIAQLESTIRGLLLSTSWRVMYPFRQTRRITRRVMRRRTSPELRLPTRPDNLHLKSPETPNYRRSGRPIADGDVKTTCAGDTPNNRVVAPAARKLPLWLENRDKPSAGIGAAHLSLGFVEAGEAILSSILLSPEVFDRRSRARAAYELALHCARTNQSKLALDRISSAYEGDPGLRDHRKLWFLEAQCEATLGNLAQAHAILDLRSEELEAADFYLLAAIQISIDPHVPACEQGPALRMLNIPHARNGIPTVEPTRPSDPLSIDNLRGMTPTSMFVEAGPTVSVVVPAFNASSTLATALESLISQTWRNLEILVVDDASSDATVDVVSEFSRRDPRIQSIRLKQNSGSYAARNAGLRASTGEFVTIHDADDWSHPSKIEQQMRLISEGHLFSMSSMLRLNSNLTWDFAIPPRLRLQQRNYSSALLQRRDAEKLEGWDQRVRAGADTEFLLRLARMHNRRDGISSYPVALPDVPLSIVRTSTSSLTQAAATHIASSRYGPRREYRDSADWWHQKAAGSSAKAIRRTSIRFPVPEVLRAGREVVIETELVIAGDFSASSASSRPTRAMIRAAIKAGFSVAVHHVPTPGRSVAKSVSTDFRDFAFDLDARIVAAGEHVKTVGFIAADPLPMRSPRADGALIACRWAALIVSSLGSASEAGPLSNYRPADVIRSLKILTSTPVSWIATAIPVRDAIAADARYPMPYQETWMPLLESEVSLSRTSNNGIVASQDKYPVLGSHGLADELDWGSEADLLRLAYCADRPCKVKIWEPGPQLGTLLGTIPENWQLLSAADRDCSSFLNGLDFFVHYPHLRPRESPSVPVLEAMAAGIPVILPPSLEKIYLDAAVYSGPADVWASISRLWQDPDEYGAVVQKGQEFVLENSDPRLFADRLSRLAETLGG